jgi:hypothetical protein
MKKLIAGGALAMMVVGFGGTAFAGEVTGSGKGGPNGDGQPGATIGIFEGEGAHSICAFSGLADGGEGEPSGPGNVQNWGHIPKAERGVGMNVPPGTSCNGHTGFVAGGHEEP